MMRVYPIHSWQMQQPCRHATTPNCCLLLYVAEADDHILHNKHDDSSSLTRACIYRCGQSIVAFNSPRLPRK